MVMFEVNSSRQDPYKNFKFQVLWEGQAVAGLSKIRMDLLGGPEVLPLL